MNPYFLHRNFFILIYYLSLYLFSFGVIKIDCWPQHDISTLRLLQIVHTHGDRTPSNFVHNDPYADLVTFWRQGVGQLTKNGLITFYANEIFISFISLYI